MAFRSAVREMQRNGGEKAKEKVRGNALSFSMSFVAAHSFDVFVLGIAV